MASVVHHASPFAETEKPPPPVVLLLLQTDLNAPTSTGLVIYEDLEHPVPTAKKKVVFAPVFEHTYPPPMIFEATIPTPTMLTRKIIEHHEAWEGGERETIIIKVRFFYLTFYLLNIPCQTTVHALVDKLLDTTKSLTDQDPELVQEVFQQVSNVLEHGLLSFNSHCCTGRPDASRPAQVRE
jgi:hypothetical protein